MAQLIRSLRDVIQQAVRPFLNLRAKLVLFTSLLIIGVTLTLSAYFFQREAANRMRSLTELGTVLAKNLASNSRYAAITEDTVAMQRSIAAVLAEDQAVYATITAPDGRRLAGSSKGHLADSMTLTRNGTEPVYPPPGTAATIAATGSRSVVITEFAISAPHEHLYDFALPIFRRVASPTPDQGSASSALPQHATSPDDRDVIAVVQVGLTGVNLQRAMAAARQNVVVITCLIILAGLGATTALAGRIVTPLNRLTRMATRVAQGDWSATEQAVSQDEVGQLTEVFNRMTQSLRERDAAITAHIETITNQVGQLTTLNRAAAAIAATLDTDRLLDTVLDILIKHMRFVRVRVVLYDDSTGIARSVRMTGASPDVEARWGRAETVIVDDGGSSSDLLLRGRVIVVDDITRGAHRLSAFDLEPARESGVVSFTAVPLKTQQRILGYLSADRGAQSCTPQDADLLATIASELAVGLDNALAYRKLEQMTATLEEKVRERTQALESANAQLRELDRLKSVFVTIVSHELRTPMTSIRGYIDNMLEGVTGELPERQMYYLRRVKHNTERLTRLINDLLDLTTIESGKTVLRRTAVRVDEVMDETAEMFQSLAQEKGIALQTVHEAEGLLIDADRDKIHQVLTNLVSNALKFTQAPGRITLQTQLGEGGVALFSVRDTGVGISPADLPRIFDRFYRGNHGTKEQRGAGLGLAIVKSLVELHGGRVWAESEVARGTSVFFTVPLA